VSLLRIGGNTGQPIGLQEFEDPRIRMSCPLLAGSLALLLYRSLKVPPGGTHKSYCLFHPLETGGAGDGEVQWTGIQT
jgi:hypothetical protein